MPPLSSRDSSRRAVSEVGAPARRIYGLETEYGITCASTVGGVPPLDADRAARLLFEPVVARFRTSNAFTRGGARLYLDVGSHPEYATAECDRLTDLLAQDRAGEITMADLAARANARLAARDVPGRIHLFKNNSDAAGAGFGCHENYLVHRRADFWNDARTLVPHLVTRQILVGAGHVLPGADGAPARYVFSQRADQMEDAVSSATTRSRPLINTRDEPHADATRYRRLHVIVGDSNIAQGSTLLKAAAMDLLLDYLEKGGSLTDLRLANPMRAIRDTCHDLSGRAPLELADGRTITPLDLQTEHLARVRAHTADLDLSELHRRALDLWERGLDAVARGRPQDVAADLDWAAKHRLLTRCAERAGTGLDDPRVARLALAYHDVSPEAGLRPRLEGAGLLHRLVDEARARAAVDTPPATTRARLRGAAVALAQDLRRDLTVDWVNLRLDDGRTPPLALRDPFACADERVDALLDAMTRRDAPAPSWPPTI
ncbi:Pup--protein ligase [Actinomyces sp. oral taxon 414]|uniref:Pup--protein ligase n=1 Tax=Actinomyces sp. oral taxon 414 TaxID=712122 RepID=UPI0006AD8A1D|nr:Pup--protein ligase [Actinomyces sp. oral taxon 414]ALC99122.1 Pup--protein ligase [Actinomyces sp. oral taxon 414]